MTRIITRRDFVRSAAVAGTAASLSPLIGCRRPDDAGGARQTMGGLSEASLRDFRTAFRGAVIQPEAKAQKYLVRINELVPLTKGNPEEFKKQYIGPDTEAKLQAATSSAADKARIRDEQTFWNRYNLNAILLKNLTKFIEQAGRVDFKAATRIEHYGMFTSMYFADGGLMSSLEQFECSVGPAANRRGDSVCKGSAVERRMASDRRAESLRLTVIRPRRHWAIPVP